MAYIYSGNVLINPDASTQNNTDYRLLEMYNKQAEWAAWYSGDPDRLSNFYMIYNYGQVTRNFWTPTKTQDERTRYHIPIAGDIASVSSDMLFGESPTVSISEAEEENPSASAIATKDRLDDILASGGFLSVCCEAAELNSALGGSYLKIDWDKDIVDHPVISVASPDAAIAEFGLNKYLMVVSFVRIIAYNSPTVIRHVERHERGIITNYLYKGTTDKWGMEIPLTDFPQTANLLPVIYTGIDDILVRYIPNKLPNKLWCGSPYGISDYQGLEGIMGALDEAYSSWLDDLHRARGRTIVPQSWLERDADTGEFKFNEAQQIYVAFPNMGPPTEGNEQIHDVQFDIRAEEHEQTCLNLLERIITSAGFSPQSFGLNIQGRAESGTALELRERKSLQTKQKKEHHFRAPLEDILRLLLAVDAKHFGSKVDVNLRPRVTFADTIRESMSEKAASVLALSNAMAASTETKVRYIHDDWTEQEVTDEVERIKEENGIGVEVPEASMFGTNPEDNNTDYNPDEMTTGGTDENDNQNQDGENDTR